MIENELLSIIDLWLIHSMIENVALMTVGLCEMGSQEKFWRYLQVPHKTNAEIQNVPINHSRTPKCWRISELRGEHLT